MDPDVRGGRKIVAGGQDDERCGMLCAQEVLYGLLHEVFNLALNRANFANHG
jgi:hypothetical protein